MDNSTINAIVDNIGINKISNVSEIEKILEDAKVRVFSENFMKIFDNRLLLSAYLSKMSEEQTFADLIYSLIPQSDVKDKFISDVLVKVKDLTPNERQKVFDYFGFELHHNKNNPTGFSITGYPISLKFSFLDILSNIFSL